MLSVKIKSFAYDSEEILKDIAFDVKPGEHLAVLGESGCGKSTLLHLIYGLLHLEAGSIQWKKTKLLGPRHNLIPGEHFMKLVSQEFNIMPFTSVTDNIAIHLSRLDTEKDASRVRELLRVVGLEKVADVKVKNLSGGQKQRVALAKALAKKPKLLLLDEPFSNIDTFRKNNLRRKLYSYLKEYEISCVTATHDSEEALSFSDNMMLLKNGKMVSYGSPEEVYNSVSTEYQAGFFGEVSLIPAGLFSSEALVLLPHQLSVSEEKTALQVMVKRSFFKGGHYLIQCDHLGKDLFARHRTKLKVGQKIYLNQF